MGTPRLQQPRVPTSETSMEMLCLTTTRQIMTFQIVTRGDALRHTAGRVAVAVSLTVVMTTVTMLLQLGTDLDARVGVGAVLFSTLCAAVAISAVLTGGLSFRSALLMRDLTLARSEL